MTAPSNNPSITLRGASGANYPFIVYRWGTQFNPVCAVYGILALRNDGLYHVVYIGQTGNCNERFDAHHKAFCFTRNGATHIGLLLETSEPRRLAIETDLVRGYNPPCNG
jgi:hypothetical protein